MQPLFTVMRAGALWLHLPFRANALWIKVNRLLVDMCIKPDLPTPRPDFPGPIFQARFS